MRILCVGLDHKTASLAVRELFGLEDSPPS